LIVTETERLDLLVANKTVKTVFCLMRGAEPEVAAPQDRIANVERARILSASAVVCFHAFSESSLARNVGTVGILIFLLSFCAFVANRTESRDLSEVAKRKSRRLLKPWLFWSVVYGALVVAKVIFRGVPISEAFHPTMLLVGTRTHLWFLPFAFAGALFVAIVCQRIGSVPKRFNIVAAILIGALCVCVCSILQSRFQPPTPLRQWILGTPAIILGLAVGRITLVQKARERRNLYLLAALSTAVACIAVVLLCGGPSSDYAAKFAIRYCISVAVLCSALHWQGSLDPISRKLASLSYGVYLVHPLVLIFLHELRIAVQHPLVSLLLAMFISAVVTEVLKKTPLRQFV
jgi:peptidoglycan/LPS O-acetylase OafA/YrhL